MGLDHSGKQMRTEREQCRLRRRRLERALASRELSRQSNWVWEESCLGKGTVCA